MNGKTIRDALQLKGRTMVDLAAFLGTTPQNINNILTKDKFRLSSKGCSVGASLVKFNGLRHSTECIVERRVFTFVTYMWKNCKKDGHPEG